MYARIDRYRRVSVEMPLIRKDEGFPANLWFDDRPRLSKSIQGIHFYN